MTIAAGFVCADGVLLGADTRVETYEIKYEQSKIFDCSPPSRDFALLMTGCGNLHTVAALANKLRRRLEKNNGDLAEIEKAIDGFCDGKPYRQALTDSPDMQLLFGILPIEGEAKLFSLYQHDLAPVSSYHCVGVGYATARYLAKWLYDPGMPIGVFGPLALQIFGEVKKHNSGCDDQTKIAKLFNKGRGKGEPQMIVVDDSEFLWGLHGLLKPVISACVDASLPDQIFDMALEQFCGKMRDVRAATKREKESREKLKQILNAPKPI